ncbi:MAG: 2-oxo acid dehydrogenase subunit E2 [Sedimentisphaerales bacterium]|nr:2-oxo acid dehydrogenase subunit E2 [Sedimentisphaerales bacterium]
MPREIRMPDLGTAVSQVTVVRWLKAEGDSVKRGEPLCEVETDKATSELESIAEGVLLRQVAAEGSTVEVGDVVAYVGRKGEVIEGVVSAETTQEHKPVSAANTKTSAGANSEVKASPMIVNLAKRLGIDLNQVTPTGPGGQVTRSDVLQAKDAPKVEKASIVASAMAAQKLNLTKNQLSVSRTISTSWREVVPISLWAGINMNQAIALREKEGGARKIAFDAIFVHAAAQVIREHPNFQCYYENDALVSVGGVNIAVAVSGEKGLFLPVVKNADQQSLKEIDRQVRDFAARAANDQLTLEELGGATFTISNLGMLPIDSFTAIIPPRQGAILTIGAIKNEVAFKADNCFGVNKVTQAILTVDHRFINGRDAAQFLSGVKEVMETL